MNPVIGALREALDRDHARLENLFCQLMAAFEADARDEIYSLWSALDAGLTAHMDAEEKGILPLFAKAYPEEAAALLGEHHTLRSRLMELGVGVDLHLVRAETAAAFIDVLRRHAKREDELLYRWADERLNSTDRAAALQLVTSQHGNGSPDSTVGLAP